MVEDIIKLKAEIFDLVQKQEEYVSKANELQQSKNLKLRMLKDSIGDDLLKLKAEIFDLMQEQEQSLALANGLQQTKSDKLKELKDLQIKAIPQTN